MTSTFPLSVLSQKFGDKVRSMRGTVPQPRQGRKMVAEGVSPGNRSPHPAFGTPLPPARERGRGRGRGLLPPGLAPLPGLWNGPSKGEDFFS